MFGKNQMQVYIRILSLILLLETSCGNSDCPGRPCSIGTVEMQVLDDEGSKVDFQTARMFDEKGNEVMDYEVDVFFSLITYNFIDSTGSEAYSRELDRRLFIHFFNNGSQTNDTLDFKYQLERDDCDSPDYLLLKIDHNGSEVFSLINQEPNCLIEFSITKKMT